MTETTVRPIRRQVVVPVPPEVAFDVFTAEIGLWWPLAQGFSVHGDGATVRFADRAAGGELVEESGAERAVWGTVIAWEPPGLLRLTWHPGRTADESTDLSVSFAPIGDGTHTLVTLEHSGWERFADPVGSREEYTKGWPTVLGTYTERVAAVGAEPTAGAGTVSTAEPDAAVADRPAEPDAAPVWLVLMHTPGPQAPADGAVFAHPDFREHAAFLGQLHDAGALVAAGPFDDVTGDGMTVVRARTPADAAELVRRAQDDDQSVARGLLMVRVRPWSVLMHAVP